MGTDIFFRVTPSVVPGSESKREGAEVGGVESVVGVVEDDDACGEGVPTEVVVGGALVLRMRSTLMLATIRIISISPEKEGEWEEKIVSVITHPHTHTHTSPHTHTSSPSMLAISNAVEPLFPLRLTAAPLQPSNLATSYLLETHNSKWKQKLFKKKQP